MVALPRHQTQYALMRVASSEVRYSENAAPRPATKNRSDANSRSERKHSAIRARAPSMPKYETGTPANFEYELCATVSQPPPPTGQRAFCPSCRS